MILKTVLCLVAIATVEANIPLAQILPVPQKAASTSSLHNHGPAPSESFPFQEHLNDDFTLYWNFNTTHITFEMVVKTNGWVGFGISPKGAMKSSDVIIAWVKDGQAHFADRHAEGHFLPAIDSSQDWTLVMAQETGQFTMLKVARPLETCDDQDVPIKPGTTRVIYAYSQTDPSSDDAIGYHGNTRGTKSILLLDPPTNEQHEEDLPADVKILEFTNRNVSVPSEDTTYHCTMWKLPDLGGKNHMIRYEPIIQVGHETLIHHMVLYYCSGTVSDGSFPTSDFNCYVNPPTLTYSCYNILVAWAIGGKVFNFPKNVGYPVGEANDPGIFMLETHYDNPRMRSDFVDSSGMRMYVTSQLRQHDAGIIMVGVNVDKYHIIPPYEESFLSQGICHESCLAEGLGGQEIHVFANFLHAHLLGSKLRTRHFRNGTELPPLQEDNNYDFDYQETRFLNEERVIKKGDSLVVECECDSTKRTGITYGGLSSREEMCESFMLYYPRTRMNFCGSRIIYKAEDQYAGRDMLDVFPTFDWTDPKVHQDFRQTIADSEYAQICYGNMLVFKTHLKVFPMPKIENPYKKQDVCPLS
ncbi:hypothetical protein EGW08_023195 [Elysia chlorotica]|uniref:DOMON domain-containing protein n=1 Tax=Elysia chlorotica TaxID=188477 RepID=A0A3S1B0P7_ELYCH|nr:hypothetical protein EGW08_023195 [Elysia chlorotica]